MTPLAPPGHLNPEVCLEAGGMGRMLDALNSSCNLSMTLTREGLTVTANGAFGIVAAVVVIAVVMHYAPHVLPWLKR